MGVLDMRTIMICFIAVDIVSSLVFILLWLQTRNRFRGTIFWVLNFLFQTFGISLIALRGLIPDWISFLVSNTLSITGITLGYFGLLVFFGKKIRWIFNAVLIVLFASLQHYFAFVSPDLNFRNLLLSTILFVIFFQSAYLMLWQVPQSMRKLSRFVGIVFTFYCAVNIVRIVQFFVDPTLPNDYLHSGDFQAAILIIYQILFIFLTFSLVLMFNNYLQMKITRQEEKFSKAFYSAPFAILVTRLSDGMILEINKAFSQLTGYSAEECLGKLTVTLNIWNDSKDRDTSLAQIRKEGKLRDLETVIRNKSGELLTVIFSADLIDLENEKCILISINNITRRKKAEEALIKSEERLKLLNASKDKFFSIIAHDLKSPFNSIIGFSSLLEERIHEKDYNGIDEYSKIILNASQRAMDLLMNLLEWSRAQTGRLEFVPEFIEMGALINETVSIFTDTAQQKSITISKDFPTPAVALADRSMASSILRNLLSNAIKFTAPGGAIIVRAKLEPKELIISITDSGIGISQDNIKRLFRIEEGYSTMGTANEKGTGLGLILCKEFIEKQRGRIWVESELGKGSTFHFSLPLK